MLNRDATRESSGEIPNELLERRRRSEGIRREDLQQSLGFGAQTGSRELTGVLLSLLREDDAPCRTFGYQPGFSEHSEIGVRSPLRIDSLIPGIESR